MFQPSGPTLWESTQTLRVAASLGFLLLVAAGLVWYVLSRRGSQQIMEGFARRCGLDPTAEPAQGARLKLRRRWLISSAFGAVPIFLFGWGWISVGVEKFPILLGYLFLTVLAVGVGRTVAVFTEARTHTGESEPVVRQPRPAVPDYVSQSELRVARVAPVISLAAAGVLGVFQTTDVVPGTPGTTLLLGLLPVAVFLVVGRVGKQLATSPQHEETNIRLIWDDALRADALQNLFQVVPAAAAYVLLQIVVLIPTVTPGTDYFPLYAAAAAAVIVMWFISLLLVSHTEPAKHFQRRLWPTADTDK